MSKEKVVSPYLKETKIRILEIINILKSDQRYQMPKVIDRFVKIQEDYQREMIRYIEKYVGNNFWKESAEDSTLYLDVFRSILFYYSGRSDLKQPSKEELIKLLVDFARSEEIKTIEDFSASVLDMSDALSEI